MGVRDYAIKRVIQMIPILIGISILIFGIMYAVPGDPITQRFSLNPNLPPSEVERMRHNLGLDKPWYIQYGYWLNNVLHLDFGNSYISGEPVTKEIKLRFWNTMIMQAVAYAISLIIAIPIGVLSAVKQYSKLDNIAMTGALMGVSMPIFWFALMAIFLFSLHLGWFPSQGAHGVAFLGKDIPRDTAYYIDYIKHLVLPVIALAVTFVGFMTRLVRSNMLEVLRQDYIMTARSKGLKERVVIYKHALRNGLLPVVTVVGLNIALLIGGAPITETVFSWPGMGKFYVSALGLRDYPVCMGILMMFAVLIVVANFIVDISYTVLDPRVKY
ncbi:MAG: ABC transporter permease [Candidatus Methanofastidiosia archaeon]